MIPDNLLAIVERVWYNIIIHEDVNVFKQSSNRVIDATNFLIFCQVGSIRIFYSYFQLNIAVVQVYVIVIPLDKKLHDLSSIN